MGIVGGSTTTLLVDTLFWHGGEAGGRDRENASAHISLRWPSFNQRSEGRDSHTLPPPTVTDDARSGPEQVFLKQSRVFQRGSLGGKLFSRVLRRGFLSHKTRRCCFRACEKRKVRIRGRGGARGLGYVPGGMENKHCKLI